MGRPKGEKIRMTVTINPAVSPVLFAELAPLASARARATRLRSLAEALLLQSGREPVAGVAAARVLASTPSRDRRIADARGSVIVSPDPGSEPGISSAELAAELGALLD